MVGLVTWKNDEDPSKKKNALEPSQHFPHYKPIGIFFNLSRAANSAVPGPILPNFEPIQAFIAVLVTYKNEDIQIKKEGARLLTTLYIHFSDTQGQFTQ